MGRRLALVVGDVLPLLVLALVLVLVSAAGAGRSWSVVV